MTINNPYPVHSVTGSLESEMLVDILKANGISAYSEEDQSSAALGSGTASLWRVWIDKSNEREASKHVRGFAKTNANRENPEMFEEQILAECEDCGRIVSYPGSLDGTTQECPHCLSYLDVGEIGWDDDFGEEDEDELDDGEEIDW